MVACTFYNNSARQGGAIYIVGTNESKASAQIGSGSVFLENYATNSGGAIYIESVYEANIDIGNPRDDSFVCSDYYDVYDTTTNPAGFVQYILCMQMEYRQKKLSCLQNLLQQ